MINEFKEWVNTFDPAKKEQFCVAGKHSFFYRDNNSNEIKCKLQQPTFTEDRYIIEINRILNASEDIIPNTSKYMAMNLYTQMYYYYNDNPLFDNALTNSLIHTISRAEDANIATVIFSHCMHEKELKDTIKGDLYKIMINNINNYNYPWYSYLQVVILISEDFDDPEIEDVVANEFDERIRPFIKEQRLLKAINKNPIGLYKKIFKNLYDPREWLAKYPLLATAFFRDLKPEEKNEFLFQHYRYDLKKFIRYILPIDMRYAKLLYYIFSKRDDNGKSIHPLIDEDTYDNPITEEEKEVYRKSNRYEYANSQHRKYRYCKDFRQMLAIMKACIQRRVVSTHKSLIGNGLCFLHMYDYDFYRIYNAMYNKRGSSIF